MDTVQFSYGKRAIFPKVKEIKRLHGGVAVYAAHARARIDAEIGKKSRFRMKTIHLGAATQGRHTINLRPWPAPSGTESVAISPCNSLLIALEFRSIGHHLWRRAKCINAVSCTLLR